MPSKQHLLEAKLEQPKVCSVAGDRRVNQKSGTKIKTASTAAIAAMLLLGQGSISQPAWGQTSTKVSEITAQLPGNAPDAEEEEMTYGDLLSKIKNGEVREVEIDQIAGIAKVSLKTDGPDSKPRNVKIFSSDVNLDLQKALQENNVAWEAASTTDNSVLTSFLTTAFVGVLVILFMLMLLRRSASSGGGAMSFGRSKARFQMEAKTGVVFDDVAGIDEAKEELQEVVTFLKNPEKFTAIGARIPKGVLLSRPTRNRQNTTS